MLAALALAALLAAGFAHGHGAVSSVGLLPGFIFGFLLPLVSGALAQLLPVWRFPGPRSPARDRYAIRLAGGAPVRALLFVVAGVLAIAGLPLAPWLAAAGVLWFIGRAIGRAAA